MHVQKRAQGRRYIPDRSAGGASGGKADEQKAVYREPSCRVKGDYGKRLLKKRGN